MRGGGGCLKNPIHGECGGKNARPLRDFTEESIAI